IRFRIVGLCGAARIGGARGVARCSRRTARSSRRTSRRSRQKSKAPARRRRYENRTRRSAPRQIARALQWGRSRRRVLQFDSKWTFDSRLGVAVLLCTGSMSAKKHEPIRATPRQRVGVVIVGVLLMLPGIAALIAGSLFYTDS